MAQIRLFLANAKGDDEEDLGRLRSHAVSLMQRYLPGVAVAVTTGFEDFQANFARCRMRDPRDGGWRGWAWEVASAADMISREPRYHGVVCPHEKVGKATVMIVAACKALGKPVYHMAESCLRLVVGIEQTNPKDKVHGWKLTCTELPLPQALQAALNA